MASCIDVFANHLITNLKKLVSCSRVELSNYYGTNSKAYTTSKVH